VEGCLDALLEDGVLLELDSVSSDALAKFIGTRVGVEGHAGVGGEFRDTALLSRIVHVGTRRFAALKMKAAVNECRCDNCCS